MALVPLKPGQKPTMWTTSVYKKGPQRYPQVFHHLDAHHSIKQWAAVAQAMRLDALSVFERCVVKDEHGNIVRDTAGDYRVGGLK